MCGIAGILGKNPKTEELNHLLSFIEHRGEEKYRYETLITKKVALGMHRLGIVDESHGKQPFKSRDQKVVVIFNGEIYNHSSLRESLSSEFCFSSNCDTEVILYSYLKWGHSFVKALDGKFAIAIYDGHENKLLLARDPMGIKPLYYSYKGEQLYFSSEIKALAKSIPSQIIELPPGCIYFNSKEQNYFTLGRFNSKRYFGKERSDKLPILKSIMKDAVEKRINKSDKKIACLLSGGIDSSIITYLASTIHQNVVAYTLSEPKKESDDLLSARALCDFLKIEHVIVSPPTKEMINFYLKEGVYMTETFEPVLVRNAVAYHFVCKQIFSDGFKYCLNGEGADELFGGYDFIKEAITKDQDSLIRYSLSIIHKSYLKMADRASMYTTLEARVPYMDKKLVEFALKLPSDARIQGNKDKVALRELFEQELPSNIINRKKVGMNEGAGFGINLPNHSIYYRAVKAYYDKFPDQYQKDLLLCSQENKLGHINLSIMEEIYNYARFIDYGFNKLKDGTTRLQLNTPLRCDLAA